MFVQGSAAALRILDAGCGVVLSAATVAIGTIAAVLAVLLRAHFAVLAVAAGGGCLLVLPVFLAARHVLAFAAGHRLACLGVLAVAAAHRWMSGAVCLALVVHVLAAGAGGFSGGFPRICGRRCRLRMLARWLRRGALLRDGRQARSNNQDQNHCNRSEFHWFTS